LEKALLGSVTRGGEMRLVLIILDGAGIGAMPDAAEYGDEGSNTLVNTARALGGLDLPNLQVMALGNLAPIPGIPPKPDCSASYGVMLEKSKGKDTTTGHWEMAGLITDRPFPTYPHGFPKEVISAFEHAVGREVLGNIPASGTEIIERLGREHIRTGKPIVYTSADSVFQIAAHEDVIPVERLYEMCLKARAILTGEHAVGRVIARPFIGEPGKFIRTDRRRDFSLPPPKPTVLDALREAGHQVIGIGKICDIFADQGLTSCAHITGNLDGIRQTIEAIRSAESGLIFTNLVDFDTLYGHRNDPKGFAHSLREFDDRLPEIQAAMRDDDLLIITADHGNDPTTPSTDHSREMVPLLVWGRSATKGVNLGTRETFADIAATICDLFSLSPWPVGESFARASLA
jgi:phosphopentomutase